jgi:hypothetical protein
MTAVQKATFQLIGHWRSGSTGKLAGRFGLNSRRADTTYGLQFCLIVGTWSKVDDAIIRWDAAGATEEMEQWSLRRKGIDEQQNARLQREFQIVAFEQIPRAESPASGVATSSDSEFLYPKLQRHWFHS